MKKSFLFITVFLFVFNSNAQVKQTAGDAVSFGLKGGVNFASITGDDTDNLSGLTSFHFGALVNIPVSENFSVQPELLYSAQGAEYGMSEGYDGKFKLGYLNIPVLAKIEVTNGLSVEAGPQIGLLLSAKDEYKSPGDSGEDDIKDDVKGLDFALALGLSYTMESGLGFGARYNIGLSEIPDDPDFDVNWKNSVFALYIAYFFL
jgi:hypothetical protein